MTVDVNDRLDGPYSGNDVTVAFAYTFRIEANTELRVILRSAAGVDTTKTLTTHYTVSGVGVDGGGNVTFVTAPATGEKVIIEGVKPKTQTVNYTETERFPYDSHQAGIDKLLRIDQEQQRDIDRTVKYPHGETVYRLPVKPTSATKILGQNTDGEIVHLDPEDIAPDIGSDVVLGTGWEALLGLPSESVLDNIAGIKILATYAAMTGLAAATGLADNAVYCTYARATEEDGGFGFWRYDSGSSATANGGTILGIDGGGAGRFFRLDIGDAWKLRWFGCIGDGSTNDYTAFNSAATYAAAAGKWLDGEWLTYKLNTKYAITATALPLWRNMTLTFASASLSAGDKCVAWTGPALGSAVNLSGNASAGATQVTVADATGFAAGNLYMLISNAAVDYNTGTAHRKGEAVTVRYSYTSGTTITLTESIATDYGTADTARLIPITRTTGAKMQDVSIIAPTGDYYTFYGERIVDGEFNNCTARNGQRAGFVLVACFDTHGDGGHVKLSNGTGLGYAFDYSGCHNCSWRFEFVEDVGVIADGTGVDSADYNYWPSRNITVLCPTAKGISRAIWGTHPGVFNWRYGDTNVTLAIESATTTDLLQISSPRGSIGTITVTGSECRHGISIQSFACLDDTTADWIEFGGFNSVNVDMEIPCVITQGSTSNTKRLNVQIDQLVGIGDQGLVVQPLAGDIHVNVGLVDLVADSNHCILINNQAPGTGRAFITINGGYAACTSSTTSHNTLYAYGDTYHTASAARGASIVFLHGRLSRSGSAGNLCSTEDGDILLGDADQVTTELLNSATFKATAGTGDVYRMDTTAATS